MGRLPWIIRAGPTGYHKPLEEGGEGSLITEEGKVRTEARCFAPDFDDEGGAASQEGQGVHF